MAITKSFSNRLLSPFLGTAQTIQTQNARALTRDGHQWQIQVRCEVTARKWGSLDQGEKQWLYARYGLWTQDQGLQRLPLDPTIDATTVHSNAEAFLANLPQASRAVPFTANDRFEYWILERKTGLPVALVASSSSVPQDLTRIPDKWRACLPNESCLLDADGKISLQDTNDAQALNNLIQHSCGQHPHGAWFEFIDDQAIRQLSTPKDRVTYPQHEYQADEFPELLFRSDWQDPASRNLVSQYHTWQAPRLLTLTRLSTKMRKHLEAIACQQTLQVAALYRLYPQIIDLPRLQQALIEAKLLRANT